MITFAAGNNNAAGFSRSATWVACRFISRLSAVAITVGEFFLDCHRSV